MNLINVDLLRSKLLECRICTIDEKIKKLHNLSLFFERKFDQNRTEEINNKIENLHKKKMELMAAFQ